MIARFPRLPYLVAAVVVYAVADFPAALGGAIAGDIPGAGDPALVIVPFCAGFALAFFPWGRLADRIGPDRTIVLALTGVAAAGVLLAVADSIPVLVAARILEGVAAAGLPPAAQAALTTRGGPAREGRSVGALMIAVAVATTLGPVAADALAGVLGWRGAVIVLAVAAPALLAGWIAAFRIDRSPLPARTSPGSRPQALRATGPLLAGCLVAALVLGGYWTLLTRIGDILGAGGIGVPGAVEPFLAPLAAACGIVLVTLAGSATDRRGPRLPMVVVLAVGGAAALLACAAASPAVSAVGLVVVLALYWSYLPVVSVQVVRSAPVEVRATAVATLYASMWLGAALVGALGALAPGWRELVAGVAVLWLAAALVAASRFHGAPVAA